MYFQHIYDKSLAQSSYFIACQAKGVALVIDPKRDVDTYLEIAKSQRVEITHVAETHIHADFLSGARELAHVTGAKMYLSDEGGPAWQYQFDHVGLRHGDVVKLGNLTLTVLHTPGHTPESISFLLTDHPANEEPVMLFTGDFVFVGDVGRPDLLEKAAGLAGTQEQSALQLFHSLQIFEQLPPFVQVWPGHGAGSACGKALGAVPSSTIGYELLRNWAFQFKDKPDGFVETLLDGQPEPPRYFATMKKLNKENRALMPEVPVLPKLSASGFLQAYSSGLKIIDTRNKLDFAAGFVPGSINIQGNNSFATWVGWLLDYQEEFMLVADDAHIEGLTRKLMRIGFDSAIGYVSRIENLGIPLVVGSHIDLPTFVQLINKPDVQLLDVRNRSEFDAGHVKGARHHFVGTLGDSLKNIDPTKPVVLYCQSGDRATIAQSVLLKNGFADVKVFFGGVKALKEEGYPLVF